MPKGEQLVRPEPGCGRVDDRRPRDRAEVGATTSVGSQIIDAVEASRSHVEMRSEVLETALVPRANARTPDTAAGVAYSPMARSRSRTAPLPA